MASATPSEAPSSTASPVQSRGSSRERSGTSTPSLSVPIASVEKTPDEGSKLRTLFSILKKFIGVADISAVRFSLPAQLLEPVPNLEYWQYLDRPETFASIGDSDDPLGRMLATLRFWFTKDLKYVKGKPIKPYNSVLGEFFRCTWEIEEAAPPLLGSAAEKTTAPVIVCYLTEQTSHHPPVSAFYINCAEKGISARGFDQLSASFTGTRIKVMPGNYNEGIFITLHKQGDETYNLTHPSAHLGGLLRGALSISVADSCFVTCPKTKLKVILTYQEEGWLGKAQNRVQGVIFSYDPSNDTKTKLKDVADSEIIGRIEGVWTEQIYFSQGSRPFDKVPAAERICIIDVTPLFPVPKLIPPEDAQIPNESRRMWQTVTDAILARQYTAANTAKQDIEERQRQKAADRKARNVEWTPRFFTAAVSPPGRPELSAEGRDVMDKLRVGDWALEPARETAS